MAGISGWKYKYHLRNVDEKYKDGEIVLHVNDFREIKGVVSIKCIMFELKLLRER